MDPTPDLDRLSIDTIRFLAVDAIEKANSGHPGAPLGAAPMAYTLWDRFLKHSPRHPAWPDRDRFVLSAGHASMLLYALLHLTGYDLPLEELQRFRRWGSRTPGHPEVHLTPGVEATTGPLGQGLANAVGMALAEAHLAARFNRPGHTVVDHHTYCLAGDGDLMEGVTAEACSLAGHLGLGKLVVLYDDNGISLAGATALSFTEDVAQRFQAYGWHVLRVPGGGVEAVDAALRQARAEAARPSLLLVHTVIGDGAPHKQGTYHAHGAPLGAAEARAAKELAGWPAEAAFVVPDEVRAHLGAAAARGQEAESAWQAGLAAYAREYPDLAAELRRRLAGELPAGWDEVLPAFPADGAGIPTRKASEQVLQALAARVPELAGGSADLNPSTLTALAGAGDMQPPARPAADTQGAVGGEWGYGGRNVHLGVREHAMGAIANGMALHGGLVPYTATFLVFADYMRPPMRLAALSGLRVVFVFTHDSIGVGEDGPTHQPVEHLMNLRAVPNLDVIRPADANETAEAWRAALRRTAGPTALVLTRQKVPVLDRARCAPAESLHRGGYVLWQSAEGLPEVILIGTGSETAVALAAGEELAAAGRRVRVVALPSWEIFDRQPAAYRDEVLPPAVRARVAVEAGLRWGWERYVGLDGAVVGLDGYGASAPAEELYAHFGITAAAVAQRARELAGTAARRGS